MVSIAERVGEKPAKVRKELERAEQVGAVRSDIRKRKALEWLVEHVSVVDDDGDPIDRAELEIPTEDAAETDTDPETDTEPDTTEDDA